MMNDSLESRRALPRPFTLPFMRPLGAAALALTLAACGGGGDDSSTTTAGSTGGGTTTPPASTSAFTQSAEWTFTLPANGSSICYDFNSKAVVAGCTGTNWDLKVKSSGMSATLWTNSGTSGTGNGGAFGTPFDHTWTALSAWKNATIDPVNGTLPATVFLKDSASGVFSGTNDIASAAFEYGVTGATTDHLLYPTYRTYLITTNSALADNIGTALAPVFALQITGYYGGAGGTTSGYPSFRWVDRSAPGTILSDSVNASGSDWVYYDLVAKAVSSATGTWHIAFNRYNIKLNGGESGSGTVAGFLAKTPTGFYDSTTGKPVASKFTDASNLTALAADLTASDLAVPATAAAWKKDTTASTLSPAYTGTYPNPMNFGWYTYFPTAAAAAANGLPAVAHLISANPDAGGLIRGGEGTTYARFHLTKIVYADPNNNASAQTWTINFDVQP